MKKNLRSLSAGLLGVIILSVIILNTDDNSLLVLPQKEVGIVRIDEVNLRQSGFIVIRELINGKLGQIIEVSEYLSGGNHQDVKIILPEKRESRMITLKGEFQIISELIIVVYKDNGDERFNPNNDSLLGDDGNVTARYVETGDTVPLVILTPQAQEQYEKPDLVVLYTDEGFFPEIVEISQGDTIEFTNRSNYLMWVATNSHPAHDILSTFDQFTTSDFDESWQYTFDQKGEWEYHDHANANMEGLVIVK